MDGTNGSTVAPLDDHPRLFVSARDDRDIYAALDAQGRLVQVSGRTQRLLEADGFTVIDMASVDNIHPADLERSIATFRAVRDEPGVTKRLHLRARRPGGTWRELDLWVTDLLHDPDVRAIVVEGDDVTNRSRALLADRMHYYVLDRLPASVVVIDDAGVIVYWNKRATELFGYTPDEVLGRTSSDLMLTPTEADPAVSEIVAATGRWEGERHVNRKDGVAVPVVLTVDRLDLPELDFSGMIGAAVDNSERHALREHLAHQALHDPLTGLPNRVLFLDRLEHALQGLARERGLVGVLFIDLDRFKIINDTSGHEAGDQVLRSVAARFQRVLRPADTLARLGGDEFAICCEHLAEPAEVIALADRLTAVLTTGFVVDGREFFVSPSIGVVLGTGGPDETASTLLRDADAAMYSAKDKGRGRIELFDQCLREDIVRRAEIATELRRALDPPQFRLHFQPLVGLGDGELRGFEALLRWQHPERGLLGPGEFIDVAEDTNLIVPIGRWVLEESARQVAVWRDELPEHPITISVNLSARQIADPNLVATVRSALATYEVDPSALCLEITESVLMEDARESVTTLRKLKAVGVQLAIDDFGTGYSSLAYLKRFPVDFLKIDRSFVSGIGRETEDSVIVKAVIDLGAALGLSTVAEGVETKEQLDELRRLGCAAAQGFWWSEPLPPADIADIARGWQVDTGAARVLDTGVSEESSVLSTSELLRVLTHEMATPLTVVRGQCERMLSTLKDTSNAEESLQAVLRNALRIERLVSSLSDAQQLEVGAMAVRPALFDLVSLVRDVAPTALADDRPICVVAPDEMTVEADGARVEQILVNLLTNAEKFSPAGTPVEIRIAGTDDEVSVVVADEGAGVPPERVADIFRKFARLERSKKGVGLGLFLSRRLARAHGGELQYRRRHPVGSEFVLTLPRRSVNELVD